MKERDSIPWGGPRRPPGESGGGSAGAGPSAGRQGAGRPAGRVRSGKPPWIKARLPGGANYGAIKKLVASGGLHTVCQSARCPNLGECWEERTATFMILGDVCTRNCGFCAVCAGRPSAADRDEPRRVARAVAALGLRYAVITSVTRDDLPLGGAEMFADTVLAIRDEVPGCRVEVLVPDFMGSAEALGVALGAAPDVLNHNVETVPRLYPIARPQADFERSLELLGRARRAGATTKSGLMVGLGEETVEVVETMRRLREADCTILTVGQYLSPSRAHLPVVRYVEPGEFDGIREVGLEMGFSHVESGPLVRSSYHAMEQAQGRPPGPGR
jgi:lipoic acid synthetase